MTPAAERAIAAVLASAGTAVLVYRWASRWAAGRASAAEEAFRRVEQGLGERAQELQGSRSQLEGILQGMSEGVLVVGPGERLLLVNGSAREILGMGPNLRAGQRLAEATRQPGVQEVIRRLLSGGPAERTELELYSPRERILQLRADRCPIAGVGDCALVVFHDITELKRLERMRSEFVANVSHELKTPLTTLQGAAETLLDGALSDPKNARAFVTAIKEEAERLHRLVEDLLSIARVESKSSGARQQAIPLGPFLEELAARYRPLAARQGITLSVEPAAPGLQLQADRDQLAQALGNLLENAIKYNRSNGQVRLRSAAAAGSVTLEVEDTGIGIPAEDLPRIFERFYRVDKARSRETGGTGLGLAIVKHVAESHGGSVRAESRPNQGSRFLLTLPL